MIIIANIIFGGISCLYIEVKKIKEGFMRKGLVLMERDYEILKHLTVGPATVNNIFQDIIDRGKVQNTKLTYC